MSNNDSVKHLNVTIEVGHIKNKNKNPVAEKAARELEDKLIRQEPRGRSVSEVGLAITTARLNSCLRSECFPVPPSIVVSNHPGPTAYQDKDEEPLPVTPAAPSAPVKPILSPPTPPELTTVPSDDEQSSSLASSDKTLDPPFHTPSPAFVPEEPCISVVATDHSLSSSPCSSPEPPGPRPQRQRRPPLYLNDYVRF